MIGDSFFECVKKIKSLTEQFDYIATFVRDTVHKIYQYLIT